MQTPNVCPPHNPARDANPRPERPTSDPVADRRAERSECAFCGASVYGETVCAVCRVDCANGEPEWKPPQWPTPVAVQLPAADWPTREAGEAVPA